jgi:glycosyl transferase family 25
LNRADPSGSTPAHTAAPREPLSIVFINLKEDELRRTTVEHAFHAIGVALERLPAIRWQQLNANEQARLYSEALNRRRYFRPLTPGEKGCYASHIAAWHGLLASEHAAVVVLEDDVRPLPGFCDVVDAILALEPGWDMIKLLGREHERPRRSRPLVAAFELIDYARVPSFAAGYVLSRSGALKLLAARMPFARPVDVDLRLWWECDLTIRGVQPPVLALAQTSALSSIGGKPAHRRWSKFVFNFRYTLLNAWHRRFARP